MPLDPRIPLGAVAPKINTPFENLSVVLNEQRARDEMQTRRMQAEQQRRAMAEQQVFQQAVSQLPDFSDQSLDGLVRIAPTFGTAFRDKLISQRKEAMAAMKQQSEMEAAEAERGLSLLGVAAQLGPDAWPDLAPVIAKHVPDLAPALPQQFDPERINALRQAGMKAADQLKADREALSAVAKGEWGALAQSLANVTDPQERQERIAAYRMAGMPKAALDLLAGDPASFTMTPSQREQANDRTEGRQIQREGQAITLRGQDLSAATQRRGQDLSAATAAEGQAITKRGQDLTDARERAGAGAGGAKLSAAAVEKVAGAETALGSAATIEKMLPSFEGSLGPVYGRIQQTKQLTGMADQGYAEFAAEIATLKNAVVKATTGAAMSEPEAKRILQQVPDLTDQPAVFKARLAATKRNLEMVRRRTIELSGGSVDWAAPGAASPSEMKIGPYTVRVK